MLCRVAAVGGLPVHHHSAEYIFSGPFGSWAHESVRGGWEVRRCWVNSQCRGVLLIWIIVGHGPIALAVGAGWGLFGHFFSYLSLLFSFSLSRGDGPI